MAESNPFGPLQERFDKFMQTEIHSQRWESARVEWTLKQLKLTAEARELQANAAFADRLFFSDFNEWFPSFPFNIVAEPLAGKTPIDADPACVHPRWFASFLDLPFVRAYEQHFTKHRDSGDNRPLAMVMPRRGLAQGLVLHNGGLSYIPPLSSAHLFVTGPPANMHLCVQPYARLIDFIHNKISWRQEG